MEEFVKGKEAKRNAEKRKKEGRRAKETGRCCSPVQQDKSVLCTFPGLPASTPTDLLLASYDDRTSLCTNQPSCLPLNA